MDPIVTDLFYDGHGTFNNSTPKDMMLILQGPFVGVVYDRYGPRSLLLFGGLLHIFGILMASLGTQYYQILLAQGICSAIGASALFQPCVYPRASVVVVWPTDWCVNRHLRCWMVQAQGASSLWNPLHRLQYRPCRLPHHGVTSDSQRRLRLGHTYLRFLMLFLLIIANLTIHSFHPPQPHKVTIIQLSKPLTETQFILTTAGFFLFSYDYFVPVNYLPIQALSAGMIPDLARYLLRILDAG